MPENLDRRQNMIVHTIKILEMSWNGLGLGLSLVFSQKTAKQLGF